MSGDREMSLVEYVNALGNADHRAAQEYCDLIRRIDELKGALGEACMYWSDAQCGYQSGNLIRIRKKLEAKR